MSFFYFSLPVIAGYIGVNKIVNDSESTAHERFGDRSAAKNKLIQSSSSNPIIGVGGLGIGVNLVTSDREIQDVNRINLERFLKKQRKLKQGREREIAEVAAARE